MAQDSDARTTTWREVTEANPEHSASYARRWERMEAEGRDIDGEARLVDAMAPRNARILDAGAGTGRSGAYLAARGHRVTGVDVDPYLVDYARRRYGDAGDSGDAADAGNPAEWLVGDLAEPDPAWADGSFDLVFSAGNVLAFIAPGDRARALANLRDALTLDRGSPGRLVVGFGLDRGWAYEAFASDCARAGLAVQHRFSSWDLRPFDVGVSGFLVAVLERVLPPRDGEAEDGAGTGGARSVVPLTATNKGR